ncbi:hypothetical protein Tco_0726339 [Tanacetum coccineum]|uniref:Uncharacterized protein n=1 Tax=Tanacetum coccineum TaxID=301880 RepID=A0ABQ4YHM9_9ASTR
MFNDSDFDVLDDAMENVEGGSTAGQITTAGDTLNIASINVSTVRPLNVSAAGPSISTARDIFEDEMTTITDTLVAIRSSRPRTTSVVIHNVEEEPRRATPEEEREQFSIDEQARFLVETIAERKRFFAAQRAEQIRNKPPTIAQLRNKMVTFMKHMGKYTHNQLRSKSFEEIQKLYEREQKWINDFFSMDDDSGKKDDDSEQQAESSKKRPRADLDDESAKK